MLPDTGMNPYGITRRRIGDFGNIERAQINVIVAVVVCIYQSRHNAYIIFTGMVLRYQAKVIMFGCLQVCSPHGCQRKMTVQVIPCGKLIGIVKL